MDDLIGRTAVVTGGGSGIGHVLHSATLPGGHLVIADGERRGALGGVEATSGRAPNPCTPTSRTSRRCRHSPSATYAEFGTVHVCSSDASVLILRDVDEAQDEGAGSRSRVNVFGVLNGIYSVLAGGN